MKQEKMWRILQFLAFLDYALCLIYDESLAFHCEVFRFSAGALFHQEGIAMKGHVKKTINASSLIQCGQKCLLYTEWCVSINFNIKQSAENTPRVCELNNFGVQSSADILVGKGFENREGYIFSQLRPYQYGCNSNPCQNGATCYYDCASRGVKCRCTDNAFGKFCENINDCHGVVCQNGGTCKDMVNDFTCSCVAGFSGRHCETNIDDCSGVVCQNGGTCKDMVNDFKCTCLAGYSGRQCETNINECSGVVCKNGGTCKDLVNDFTCSCVVGYSGQHCETNINDCNGVVCQNGGTCKDLINDFECSCVAGYSGKHCESDVDECASKPCLNGGTCNNLQNNFTCTCPETHRGLTCNLLSTCEIEYSTCSTSNVILYPLSTNIQAFTMCSWFQLKDSQSVYPLSYTQTISSLGIGLMSDGRIFLKVNGNGRYSTLGILRDGRWQHLCIAWRSSDGAVRTYRNGVLQSSTAGLATGSTVYTGNQINIGRRSDLGACFIGRISNFNAWSSFLSGEKIANMASSCQPLDSEGTLVSWSELKKKTFSGIVVKCCPGSCYT